MPNAPQDPLSDEAIDSLVNMVEAAEVLATSLEMSVSMAMRMMLKSTQVVQQLAAGKQTTALRNVKSTTKRPQ